MGSCKIQDQLESIGIPNSENSIASQADYVTMVEDRPIISEMSSPSYISPKLTHAAVAWYLYDSYFSCIKHNFACSMGFSTIAVEWRDQHYRQPDPIGVNSPIFNLYLLIVPQP